MLHLSILYIICIMYNLTSRFKKMNNKQSKISFIFIRNIQTHYRKGKVIFTFF